MVEDALRLTTKRLTVRSWREDDRCDFAALLADEDVMRDQGGPVSRADADAKFGRYVDALQRFGYGRLAVELTNEKDIAEFLGYVGVMPVRWEHPLGDHAEVGWRLKRSAWGHGYATEAARVTLRDAFDRTALTEVLSYTAPDNLRSQSVMNQLGLRREAARDFRSHYDGVGEWSGMVWVADRSTEL